MRRYSKQQAAGAACRARKMFRDWWLELRRANVRCVLGQRKGEPKSTAFKSKSAFANALFFCLFFQDNYLKSYLREDLKKKFTKNVYGKHKHRNNERVLSIAKLLPTATEQEGCVKGGNNVQGRNNAQMLPVCFKYSVLASTRSIAGNDGRSTASTGSTSSTKLPAWAVLAVQSSQVRYVLKVLAVMNPEALLYIFEQNTPSSTAACSTSQYETREYSNFLVYCFTLQHEMVKYCEYWQ